MVQNVLIPREREVEYISATVINKFDMDRLKQGSYELDLVSNETEEENTKRIYLVMHTNFE